MDPLPPNYFGRTTARQRGSRKEEGRSIFRILPGEPTGNIALGRPRRRWEDNIRMYLKEIRISTKTWVDAAQDRDYWRALVNAAFETT